MQLPAPPPQPPNQEKRPKWRVFTWVILVTNVLFLVWVIAGAGSAANNCAGKIGADLDACRTGTAVGAAIGIGIIVFFWVAADIILGVIWLVTRGRSAPDRA